MSGSFPILAKASSVRSGFWTLPSAFN